MPTRPIWAEISRRKLLNNYCLLRQAAGPPADVLPVVKANAYGHDVLQCAPLLAQAGAEWLGVTCVEEAVAVRAICPEARVLVMSGLWQGEADAVLDNRLTPLAWEPFHFALLEAAAQRRGWGPRSFAIHLEIDTGMARQGVRLETLPALLERWKPDSPVLIEGVMTHFSAPEALDSDDTSQQMAGFSAALERIAAHGIRPRWIHAGNSATLLARRETSALAQLAKNYGARLMLRPGLTLYGYPARFSHPVLSEAEQQAYKPVLSLKTRVVSLRTIHPGEGAGYNSTFRAQKKTRLALLPVGYADGLNRLLSNCGSVLVRGVKAPIAGRVSMDQTIIDVSHVPGIEIGDETVLIGQQGRASITAYDLSDLTGTIPYEVLCAINARVPRLLVD